MESQFGRNVCLGLGFVLLAVSCAWGDASRGPAPGTGNGQPEDLFKVYAQRAPLEPGQFEVADLARIFPDFQHEPYDLAGFNPIVLPFQYEDAGHIGDPREALAFDALMSYDLDWAPGNYCSRHAFYISQHDPRAQMLQQGYNAKIISSMVKFWRATHAIGGTLIRQRDGYEGKVEIFAAVGCEGRQVAASWANDGMQL